LNETSLARQFKVNRIPVREALTFLQKQGLVMNLPRRGMFVNSLSEADQQKINSLRIVLEGEALKLCRAQATSEMVKHLGRLVSEMERWKRGSELDAAALDLQFHRTVWGYCGNDYLEKTLEALVPPLFAYRALGGIRDELLHWILSHHRALLDIIEGNSQELPESALVAHFRIGYKDPEHYSSLACGGAGVRD
jgi:DNA-binding GntR family transcriptional regulator